MGMLNDLIPCNKCKKGFLFVKLDKPGYLECDHCGEEFKLGMKER